MSIELSIDTSTRYASVAVSRDGDALAELTWRSERNHSVELVPAIRELLSRVRIVMGEIDAVFIAKGPGAFSALRVGMSTAKTLAAALGVPLVAVGTLDIEAQPYLHLDLPVRALIGAGRNRLYVGNFEGDEPKYMVMSPDELVSDIVEKTIFCGEGVVTIADDLKKQIEGKAYIVDMKPPTRRAGILAQLGYRRLQSGVADDASTLEPLYLRSGQVEMAERTRIKK